MPLGTDYADDVIDNVVNNIEADLSYPNVYVSLHTADPGATGASEVPATNNYSRKQTAPADWNAAGSKSATNANVLTFATPSGSWGTITHAGLWTASTGGTFIAGGILGASKQPDNEDTVRFNAAALGFDL